jgi:hypothetical protein
MRYVSSGDLHLEHHEPNCEFGQAGEGGSKQGGSRNRGKVSAGVEEAKEGQRGVGSIWLADCICGLYVVDEMLGLRLSLELTTSPG